MILRDYFNELNGRLNSKVINNFIDDININIAEILVNQNTQYGILSKFNEVLNLQNEICLSGIYSTEYVESTAETFSYYFVNPNNILEDTDTYNYWDSSCIIQSINSSIDYTSKDSIVVKKNTEMSLAEETLDEIYPTTIDMTDYFTNGFQVIESDTSILNLYVNAENTFADEINMFILKPIPSPGMNLSSVKIYISDTNTIDLFEDRRMNVIPITEEQPDGTILGTISKKFLIKIPTITSNGSYKVGISDFKILKNTYNTSSSFNYTIKFNIGAGNIMNVSTVDIIGDGDISFILTYGSQTYDSLNHLETGTNLTLNGGADGDISIILNATLFNIVNTAVLRGLKFNFIT